MDEDMFDTFLDNTDNIHHFAFMQVHFEDGFYHTLVFTTEEMVYDFSFVVLDDDGGMRDIRIVDTPFTIPRFLPNEAFVLDFLFISYMFPVGGIAYTDQQGIRHFYWIVQDMHGEPHPPFSLVPFEPAVADTGFDVREQQGQNPYITQAASWQEVYAEILLHYETEQDLGEWETGWEFALHDINQDGIPELFIGARLTSGHFDYRYVYTFLGGEEMRGAVRLNFEGFVTDGAIFYPIDSSPWIVAFLPAGSSGRYIKLEMIEHGLVPTVEGATLMRYDFAIDGIEVTIEEFVNVFGTHEDRAWLNFYEVNNENIMRIILGVAQ